MRKYSALETREISSKWFYFGSHESSGNSALGFDRFGGVLAVDPLSPVSSERGIFDIKLQLRTNNNAIRGNGGQHAGTFSSSNINDTRYPIQHGQHRGTFTSQRAHNGRASRCRYQACRRIGELLSKCWVSAPRPPLVAEIKRGIDGRRATILLVTVNLATMFLLCKSPR